MKVIKTHEYRFPSYLLSALVNNDLVIDSEDRNCFKEFTDRLEQFKKFYRVTDYTIEAEAVSYFSHTNCLNDISCEVVDIRVHFLVN